MTFLSDVVKNKYVLEKKCYETKMDRDIMYKKYVTV